MAFWQRIRNNNLKIACTQFRRCYIQLPHASSFNSVPRTRPFEIPRPSWVFHDTPTRVFNSVRFFAAPVQFQSKWKKEEECLSGPRLNEEIKSKFIRLVVDDGHSVVSTFEALEQARKLKLDLVEVQRDGDPPVCKIMDYHKEIYKKQEREKERAKAKADVTLRKGGCKEMRFSEKTEAKDLKMKADMVKKLMEKGYRVKCRATGKENQDLTAALSRLHALIEDITVVESGPSMAKKEAYMIVRHIKYGPLKKGSGAARKLAEAADVEGEEDSTETLTASSSDSLEFEDQSSAESGFEPKEVFYRSESVPPAELKNRYKRADHQTEKKVQSHAQVPPAETENRNRYKRADHQTENKVQSHAQVPPAETENRYKRAEPRNRYQQTTSNNTGVNNRGPGPSMNQTRGVPADFDVNRRTGNSNQANTPESRYSRPSFGNVPPRPGPPNTPRPSYGIFSGPKGPEARGTQAGMCRDREGNS